MTSTAERIDIPTGHRPLPAEWFKTRADTAPAVLVIHEVFGLNDDMRRICRRFADNGYHAIAPDLYRGAHWARCSLSALAALRFRQGGQPADDLEAALQWMEADPAITAAGAVGFCLGGGFALCLGTRGTAKVAGGFYGDVPTLDRMAQHMCPVLGGYGGRDRLFASEGRRLQSDLDALGVANDVRVYPHAGHSFMGDAGHPVLAGLTAPLLAVGYDEQAAEDSWSRMLAFFATHLVADNQTEA